MDDAGATGRGGARDTTAPATGTRAARRLLAALTLAVGLAAAAAGTVLGTPIGEPPPTLVAAAAPAAPAPAPAAPAPAAPAPAPAVGNAGLPPELATLPASTTQAVVVESVSPAATEGRVSAWTRTADGWTSFLAPTRAFLGREGMGASSESAARTPAGTFAISQAFGRLPDPGTALPYRQVGPDDWWVGDTTSPLYNTRQVCAPGHCPFDTGASENLQAAGHAYDHAIVIDANTDPTRPGAGSAYFLHIGDHPTAGCVATDQADVVALLRWLRPGARIVLAS